jgi:hypothetical protein
VLVEKCSSYFNDTSGVLSCRLSPANAPDQKRARVHDLTRNLAPVFCIWMLYGAE